MTRISAVVGIVSISFSAIFMRLASPSPATGAFWRAAYAVPLLTAAWLLVRKRDGRDRPARWLAFGAGLLLAVDLVVWQMAIDRIGASLAVVLANVQVVFVGGLAWLLHRERPTVTALAVVPIVLVGVVMISGLGRLDAYGTDPVFGTVLGLATALTYTGFLLVFRHSNRRHLAPAAGPLLDATLGTVVGSLLLAPLDTGFTLAFSWPRHGWLLALGLVIQGLGWLLITNALPRLAALETSVLLLLQPMLTIVWARLVFAESLSTVQWLGVGVVLGGILVIALRGTVEPKGLRQVSAAAEPHS
ncbi:MAG: DMT family transporter [Actinobacteria bacterium]|nr:DMT family transporter [Actinomycetota bacterium]